MNIMQTVADTAKSSSQIVFDGAAIMALISAGGLIVRDYIRAKKRNG